MSWLDPADPDPVLRARLVSARGHVAVARATVASCRDVPWVGAAAASYRAALDDEGWLLSRLVAELETLLAAQGLPGPWPVTTEEVTAGFGCQGDGGRSLRVGAGSFVAVDPEALADAAVRLARAAGALDGASGDLSRALWGASTPWQSGGSQPGVLGGRLDAVVHGPYAPGRVADRLRDLAATTRAVAQVHGDGETAAHGLIRRLAGDRGLFNAAGVAEVLPGVLIGVVREDWAAGITLLRGEDPVPGLVRDAEQVWSDAVAAGGGEIAVRDLAGLLTSPVPLPVPDPVPVVAAVAAKLLARGSDVALVPRVDPPQLAPPRGLAGILDTVAKSYDEGQPTGLPGTPNATVTVERLDHPDGSRSWLVAIPGTQAWGFSEDVATDLGTNLELVGGLDDPMTAGVVAAMGAAGILPDEPVVLAGHSQGGMVAMSAAAVAAGTYRVAGVVTAGSPSVPARLPAGVPVVRLEHDEDLVPQTDGEPTVAGGDVTRVTRSLADDHPVLVTEAHQITGYLDTAAMTDAQVAASPGAAPGVTAVTAALGGDGTAATTFQYRVERAAKAVPAGGGW